MSNFRNADVFVVEICFAEHVQIDKLTLSAKDTICSIESLFRNNLDFKLPPFFGVVLAGEANVLLVRLKPLILRRETLPMNEFQKTFATCARFMRALCKSSLPVFLTVACASARLDADAKDARHSEASALQRIGSARAITTIYTPVIVRNTIEPIPYEGTDGKYHLVYEIEILNAWNGKATVNSITVVDADKPERSFLTLSGKNLTESLTPVGQHAEGTVLNPSTMGIGFIYLTFNNKSEIPTRLCNRVESSIKLKTRFALSDVPPSIICESEPLIVQNTAVRVLAPPVQGTKWIAANASSNTSSHRRALIPLNNGLFLSQRFAIDFMKLNDDDQVVKGDLSKCESYPCYGLKALAAADGVVIEAVDKYSDQVPGKVVGVTAESIAGNHVVIDFGDDQQALYAHLKPGTVKVHVGDRVVRGQEIGLIGNTGNTSAPHLHFHLMHGKQPLVGSGIPVYFGAFQYRGSAKTVAELFSAVEKGGALKYDESNSGPRANQQLNECAIVDFPSDARN
ncbi:MAG TPA: M23 family metallopeptidase [Oculatellaceae cyanobacterium]